MKYLFLFKIDIELAKAIKIGQTSNGFVKYIPIIGGKFEGLINGTVMSYGGDYNIKINDDESEVFAHYILEVDNGENIFVKNKGHIDKRNKAGNLTSPIFILDENSSFKKLFESKSVFGKIVCGDSRIITLEFYAEN